jgi:hypothetical protein
MSLPIPDEASWSLLEWAATGLSTIALSAAALVWRIMSRLDRMSIAIAHQRNDFDISRQVDDAAFAKLSARIEQLLDDHYRLRETIGTLPSRGDLRDLQDHIGERIETLAARFDRALEARAL